MTNYAKKHSVVYSYAQRQGGVVTKTLLNVYSDYKCWLRNYRRKDFDPFRRRYRIFFSSSADKEYETTVGQLNFIYWAHTYGVLEYARAHRQIIENDMNVIAKSSGKKNRTGAPVTSADMNYAPPPPPPPPRGSMRRTGAHILPNKEIFLGHA